MKSTTSKSMIAIAAASVSLAACANNDTPSPSLFAGFGTSPTVGLGAIDEETTFAAAPAGGLTAAGAVSAPDVDVTITPGATDNEYTIVVDVDGTELTFTQDDFVGTEDVFSGLSAGLFEIAATGGGFNELAVFDFEAAFDYTQIAALITSNASEDVTGINVFTIAEAATAVPTTGTAIFAGGLGGFLVDPDDTQYIIGGDFDLTVDFVADTFIATASNFSFLDETDTLVTTNPFDLDFTVDGTLTGAALSAVLADFTFQSGVVADAASLEGTLAGPGGIEAAGVISATDTTFGSFVVGFQAAEVPAAP